MRHGVYTIIWQGIGVVLICLGMFAHSAQVCLDGQVVSAFFTDGDTFLVFGKKRSSKSSFRLVGINALETFGPVHSLGNWSESGLFALAQEAKDRASKGKWTCAKLLGHDFYGRSLVSCDDLALLLLQQGLAHIMFMAGPKDARYVAAQESAIAQRLGMWRFGRPERIVTSVFSNRYRVVSVTDGSTFVVAVKNALQTCESVCDGESCMVYVEYANRYKEPKVNCD